MNELETLFSEEEQETAHLGGKFLGHRYRLRRRAEKDGFEALRLNEKIELLLFYVLPRRDVARVANKLATRYGSLRKLMEAPVDKINAECGVTTGENVGEWLHLLGYALALFASLDLPVNKDIVTNLGQMKDYVGRFFAVENRPKDTVWQMLLRDDGSVVSMDPISADMRWGESGPIIECIDRLRDSGAYYTMLVVYPARKLNRPLQEDLFYLDIYARMMESMCVRFLDCVFVGSDIYSMHYSGHSFMNDLRSRGLYSVEKDYYPKMDWEDFRKNYRKYYAKYTEEFRRKMKMIRWFR